MMNTTHILSRTLSTYAMFTSVKLMGDTSQDLLVDIANMELIAKCASDVLEFHHELIVKYGRGNNADLHYDQIMNMAEVKNAALLKEIDTVEDLNRNIEMMKAHSTALRSSISEAIEKVAKRTASGETIQ